MDTATRTKLAQIANEAYGQAAAGSEFAAGVEALARHLLDPTTTSPELRQMLGFIGFKAGAA